MKKRHLINAVILGTTSMTITANAASINWNAAENSAAATDIVGGGDVVLAINGISDDTATLGAITTVNGVDFSADTTLGNTANPIDSIVIGSNTSGDSDYDQLLSQNTYGGGVDTIYMINGLTDGLSYKIQVWFNDTRPGTNNRVMTYGDNEASENTVDVAADPSTPAGTSLGQFAIGDFTASGTSQDLHLVTQGFGNSHFAALLVREIPEPTAFSLLGIGSLALLGKRSK